MRKIIELTYDASSPMKETAIRNCLLQSDALDGLTEEDVEMHVFLPVRLPGNSTEMKITLSFLGFPMVARRRMRRFEASMSAVKDLLLKRVVA